MKRLFPIVLLALAGCNPFAVLFYGTEGMAVSRRDFTNGTTRHPIAYDDALASLRSCASRYSGEQYGESVDSLYRGGIYLVSHDSLSRMVNGQPVEAIYRRHEHAEYLDGESFRLRDVLVHEMAHGMSDDHQELRNPLDSLNASPNAGNLDHVGAFFRACVSYCPGCGR